MDQEMRALIRAEPPGELAPYDEALAQAGEAAERVVRRHVFANYQRKRSEATKQAQQNDLSLFSRYLASAQIVRSPEALYSDPAAWDGMNYALLEGFREWLYYQQPEGTNGQKQGYAIRSVKRRLSTVRQYCRLAYRSTVIPFEDLSRILDVEMDSYADGVNIDQQRRAQGMTPRLLPTRKVTPTPVEPEQAAKLKQTTTAGPRLREHDVVLAERDELLMCLLIEHALRVSEIVALDATSINVKRHALTVRRSKTYSVDVLELMPATHVAAEKYLPLLPEEGPLFYGYEGKRITRFGIFDRVRVLGALVGIANLSPHDLRHYWTKDVFKKGNGLDLIQRFGGWKSSAMPLYYAQEYGVTTRGLKVSP